VIERNRPARAVLFSALAALGLGAASGAGAALRVTRLTPPSELFSAGVADPIIARFVPGQRFDLQATLVPEAGQAISSARFLVDGAPVKGGVAGFTTTGLSKVLGDGTPTPPGTAVASVRGYSLQRPGVHLLSVVATQTDGHSVEARGNFLIERLEGSGARVRNVILLLGDGMGIAHRTAARIVAAGYVQGKAKALLAMDTFPHVALVRTASLNSIVTDSAPGMSNYLTGNKAANNQEGVFPDDTAEPFDNPRVEYLAELLHRTRGTALGLVTTADVYDATPAANAVHTSDRSAGTGIVDQYFDDRGLTGLRVLMGGGRKWFLPAGTPGSQRATRTDYVLPDEIVRGWGAARGSLDPGRDLLGEFTAAGWSYAANATALAAAPASKPLLGLFAFSNMNVALDKIAGRRATSSVTADFGLPDQPMLDEMARKALEVLSHERNGFVLMIEGASIDKQSHAMDSDRWLLETLEFDRAVAVARDFAVHHADTLVIVTADHECAGAALIGASLVTHAELAQRAVAGGGAAQLRDGVVGAHDGAGFPRYELLADGYPRTMDPDYKLLVGYGANADRYEDWLTPPRPLFDGQQPVAAPSPLPVYPKGYPASPLARAVAGNYLVTGQVEGSSAAHTATDVPLSAFGRGSGRFFGVIDNTDVFFAVAGAALAGARVPNRDAE
jgi:alkaline phosphatase